MSSNKPTSFYDMMLSENKTPKADDIDVSRSNIGGIEINTIYIKESYNYLNNEKLGGVPRN